MRHFLIALSLSAVALLTACSTVENPVTGKTERTVLDERAEIAAGKEAHPQILAEYGVVKDAKLQAYVNEVGQRLAKNSHRRNLDGISPCSTVRRSMLSRCPAVMSM